MYKAIKWSVVIVIWLIHRLIKFIDLVMKIAAKFDTFTIHVNDKNSIKKE